MGIEEEIRKTIGLSPYWDTQSGASLRSAPLYLNTARIPNRDFALMGWKYGN
jgi:hypothetical protein